MAVALGLIQVVPWSVTNAVRNAATALTVGVALIPVSMRLVVQRPTKAMLRAVVIKYASVVQTAAVVSPLLVNVVPPYTVGTVLTPVTTAQLHRTRSGATVAAKTPARKIAISGTIILAWILPVPVPLIVQTSTRPVK